MTHDAQSYNLRTLRDLLVEAFDTKELEGLVWDDPQLDDLRHEFAPADSIRDMAKETVDWCDRRGHIPYLVQRVKEERPEMYKVFEAELMASGVSEAPAPPPPSPEQGFDLVPTLQSRWPWIAVGLALVLIVVFVIVGPRFFESTTPTPELIDTVTPPTATDTATPTSIVTLTNTATPTPTSTATPTSTPTPTGSPSSALKASYTPTPTPAQIVLEDVGAEGEGSNLTLDIAVWNTGDKPVVIKRARIQVLDYKDFYFAGCVLGQPPVGSAMTSGVEYELDISDLEAGEKRERSIRQLLVPDEHDRFQITLLPHAETVRWRLHKLKLELIWGTPDQSVLSLPIIFTSSKSGGSTASAERLYGYQLSDDQILERFAHLGEEPYKYSSEEIISMARACYASNLRDAAEIFSEESMVLSTQADKEYKEWKKARSNTP